MGDEEMKYSVVVIPELMKIIFSRIQELEPNTEPKNVVKIMSYIFLKEPDEDDIMKLAFTSDANLISKINDAKVMGGMSSLNISDEEFPTSTSDFDFPPQYWDAQLEPLCSLDNQFEVPNYYYHPDVWMESISRKRPSSSSPRRTCHYFMKGNCKFGENCRFNHPKSFQGSYASEEHRSATPPGSLEKLEMEIAELLRSRGGYPVSIASLPILYFEKYGKVLHADGYLTESQRHGKVGYSLTKLLSRLKNSIHVVDRPHGQHSVVLAEDAMKYARCRNERSDAIAAATTTCSNQIYLTFSAESKFTNEDVADYFKQYGSVRDVRIPCQDKRMYGFVSFCDPDTANKILRNRKPHYICGARVLVKPYRQRSRNGERAYMKKTMPANYYAYQYPDPFVVPRDSYCSQMSQMQLTEKQEKMVELEGSRLSEFRLNSMTRSPFVTDCVEQVLEDPNEFQWEDSNRYKLDDSNRGFENNEDARQACNNCTDQERSQIELPESPFASESRFSTVI